MKRYPVHRLAEEDTLAVDFQSPFLASLNTRVVAPLVPAKEVGPTHLRLNPRVEFEGVEYAVLVHLMSAVSVRDLGPALGDCDGHHDAFVRARDFLFDGF